MDVADWTVKDVSYYFNSHGYVEEGALLQEQVLGVYMDVFYFLEIIQMVPNHAKHHIFKDTLRKIP